jgi:transposase
VENVIARCFGLDVHRDFVEVAVWQDGRVTQLGRVAARVADLERFAAGFVASDRVALEATSNALAVTRVVAPHVAEVTTVNARRLGAISHAKNKTDRRDAATLAQLLAAGMLDGSWQPDETTRRLRRLVARRARLVTQRTRCKNEVLAVLHRNLKPRPPMSDPFGIAGRTWLVSHELPDDEADTIDAGLRQIDFHTAEIDRIDRALAQFAIASAHAKLLMSVPGVGLITAAAFLAQVGDITRFGSPGKLVSYLGLDPRVHQSGNSPARTGRISKEGSSIARHVLTEAAQASVKTPGPLRGFYERIRHCRGHAIAIVALARKMTVLFWHLLRTGEPYVYALPTATAKKLRRVELTAGAPPRTTRSRHAQNREQRIAQERQAAEHAQTAYEHATRHWRQRSVT